MGRSGGGGVSGGGGGFGGGGSFGGHSGGGGSYQGGGGRPGGRSGGPGPSTRGPGPGMPPGGPRGPFRRVVPGGFGPVMMGPRIPMRGPGRRGYGPGGPVGPAGPAGSGCCSVIAAIIVVALVLMFAFFSFGLNSCVGGRFSSPEVPASTVEREPLPQNAAEQTKLYEDADGDWIHNPSVLEAGLKEFWQKTGVYPFVYIAPNGSLNSANACHELAAKLYDENFHDGAHMVLVFCDNNQGGYYYGYEVGDQAQTVMDSEAIQILASYLARNYDNAPTEEEVFSNTFRETANHIMTVTQPWYVTAMPIFIIIVVAVVIIVAVNAKRKRDAERDAHVREVLNQPLEKFSDQELEDLEEKYKDDL